LADAEAVESPAGFGVTVGEAGSGEQGGVDLPGFTGGEEGTGGGSAEFAKEGERTGRGGGVRNEERAGPF